MSQEDAASTVGAKPSKDLGRDAIHVAVLCVVASEKLHPGQSVGLDKSGGGSAKAEKQVGIVDPFLEEPVYEGERFWLFLRPRTVTTLRHVWEHPFIPNEGTPIAAESASRSWMRWFAGQYGRDAETMIQAAHDFLDHDRTLHGGPELEGAGVPDEFWDHFRAITGRAVSVDEEGCFFSCSC